jgi:DNA-binding protein YbaB
MVKVRVFGEREVREVTIEEAQRLLNETYNDELGGLVVDAETNEVIADINPDTREIILMQQMLGGG